MNEELSYSNSPETMNPSAAATTRGPESGSSPEVFNVIARDTSRDRSGPVRGSSERPPKLLRGPYPKQRTTQRSNRRPVGQLLNTSAANSSRASSRSESVMSSGTATTAVNQVPGNPIHYNFDPHSG